MASLYKLAGERLGDGASSGKLAGQKHELLLGSIGMTDNVVMPWIEAYPEGVAWDQPFEPRPLTQILQIAVSR